MENGIEESTGVVEIEVVLSVDMMDIVGPTAVIEGVSEGGGCMIVLLGIKIEDSTVEDCTSAGVLETTAVKYDDEVSTSSRYCELMANSFRDGVTC